MVVRQDRRPKSGAGRQIPAPGAQVGGGRPGAVLHILRVRGPVGVAVASPPLPGGGDELHRAHRTVPRSVAVPAATVGVADGGKPVSVEHGSENSWDSPVVGVQTMTSEGSGLHLTDRGEQLDRQLARAGGRRDGRPVGLPQDDRNTGPPCLSRCRRGVENGGLEGCNKGGDVEGAGEDLVDGDHAASAVTDHEVTRGDVPVGWPDRSRGEGGGGRRGTRRDRRRVVGTASGHQGCSEGHHGQTRDQRARHRDADHAWPALRVWLGHQSSAQGLPSYTWHHGIRAPPLGDGRPVPAMYRPPGGRDSYPGAGT